MKQIKKGIGIFLIITVITITIILIFTVKKETIERLKNIKLSFFILTLLCVLLRIYFECLKLQILGAAIDNKINLISSAECTIGGYFLALTPFGIGGLPYQFYILMREKLSFGESSIVIAMRGITWIIGFLLIFPLTIKYKEIITGRGVKILSTYLIILYAILILIFIIIMCRTDNIKNFLSKRSKKIRWQPLLILINTVVNEVDKFKIGFKKYFSTGIFYFILTIILSVASFFAYIAIAPIIFYSLNINVPFIETIIIQLILTFILMFSPSPGGAGIAEGLGFALFHRVCPKELLGIYVILWRFFMQYLGAIIGGFFILRTIKQGFTFTQPEQ